MKTRYEELQETLNPRHRRFAEAYALNGNATRSAEKAGYRHPRQAGTRLLSNVVISEYLSLLKRQAAEAATDDVCVTVQERKAALASIIRGNRKDGQGNPIPSTNREIIAAIIAWERLWPDKEKSQEVVALMPWARAMLAVDPDLDYEISVS